MKELKDKIMRRVYYAFFLRVGTHPLTLHLAVFALGIVALAQVVSIPNILANLMDVKVSEVAGYLFSALLNTEFITVAILSLIVLNLSWFLWRLLIGNLSVKESSLMQLT